MPKAAPTRPFENGIDASGTYPVEYRFSHATKGSRHLVVVFANFSVPGDYGWSNGVLDKVRANVLWIRDRFHGKNSYYLCKGMDFGLEQSVAGLISNVLRSLDLTPDQCTMWGGSKGGSAALYFGLKYGYRNVVAIVPQFRIGTYILKYPSVAAHIMGEVTEENTRAVDDVIANLVRAGANRQANIYVLSSPQDEQYPDQVEPFLPLFAGYENFNFIFSDSPHISDHARVTSRNVPMLMGLLNFLIDGVAPRLGFVRNGGEIPDADRSGINAFLRATAKVQQGFAPPVVFTPVSGETVDDQSVVFRGSAPGAVRLSVWERGKFLASPEVAPDGSWSWQRDRAWSTGDHPVRILAVDAAGYQSPWTEANFTVAETDHAANAVPFPPVPETARAERPRQMSDTAPVGALYPPRPAMAAPPGPVVVHPAPGQYVPGPAIALTGHAVGAAHVEFVEGGLRLGAAPVGPDGGWSWESGWSWAPGPHTVEVHAFDPHGSPTPPTSATFCVVNAEAAPAGLQY
ncbi:hypothetical protein [Streptomyces rubiginosohelvolus]|uniref:hypothetical protein n=1 Tax=Streptomyces rubiginosohelvolus TaxID=67362 RepID=UPI0035E25E76